MTKHFCDRCGNEITSESDYVHDKELCRDCQLELDKWLTEKPSSENELTTLKSLIREMFKREGTLRATYLSSDGVKVVAWKVWDDKRINEIKDELCGKVCGENDPV